MITLKLTAKNIELIIHSLGSEAIRLNDDNFTAVRDKVLEQIAITNKIMRKKSVNIVKSFLTSK